MARSEIEPILKRGEGLASEMEEFVPQAPRNTQFRADLAGLLVVAIAASYESSVKETLMGYAARHHIQFENFTRNHFNRLNSRIALSDLYGYAKTFDNNVHKKFGELLDGRKGAIKARTGRDITSSYKQMLSWRHDFAHAGIRNTTIEEALATHRYAKRVLLVFDQAFE